MVKGDRSDKTGMIELERVLERSYDRLPETSRSRIRHNVLSAVATQAKPALMHVVFVRAAAVFSALTIGLGGLTYASASALPGNPLYTLKRAMEEARVALQFGETNRADALMDMTQERVREVERLMEEDAETRHIDEATEGFGDAAGRTVGAEDDPALSQERVSEIEDTVEQAPEPVREQVAGEVPAPSPSPDPESGAEPEPEPTPTQPKDRPEDAPIAPAPGPGPGDGDGGSTDSSGPGESSENSPSGDDAGTGGSGSSSP